MCMGTQSLLKEQVQIGKLGVGREDGYRALHMCACERSQFFTVCNTFLSKWWRCTLKPLHVKGLSSSQSAIHS